MRRMELAGINPGRTIDVTNEDAKAFTYAFVVKVYPVLCRQRLHCFNMGADESMQMMYLQAAAWIRTAAEPGTVWRLCRVCQWNGFADQKRRHASHGVQRRIYYNRDTASGTFDSDILIAYWSSGWGGYNVASASFLAGQGFDLVNTNGDYYWIVGKDSCTAEKAAGFDINSFMGESSPMEAAGAMFCIWCDYPQNMTEQAVVSETADVITAFGKAISSGETTEPEEPEEPEVGTVSDEATGITVTGAGLTSVTVEALADEPEIDGMAKTIAYDVTPYAGDEAYTGEATVSVPVPEVWDTSLLHAYVQEADGSYAEVSGAYADGKYTYTAPHFSVQVLAEAAKAAENTQRVEVNAGSSTTITVPGVDLTGSVDSSALDTGIATVDVQAKESVAENNWQLVTNGAAGIVPGEQYLIVSGNSGSQYALTSGGRASQVSISDGKIESAPSGTVFTLVQNGNGYNLQDSNGMYLYPTATRFLGWNYSLATNQNSAQAVTISGNNSVTISQGVTSGNRNTTSYISYSTPGIFWEADYDASDSASNLYLFHKVETEAGINTEITISGVSEGTTSVTIGDTEYQIVVTDQAPSGALTDHSLTVEYWITNSTVREQANDYAANSTTISRNDASDENGVAIADQVPETAYSNYDGWVEVKFWQAMRLDSQNQQSGNSGDDETADGTTFTHVRWHNNAWQYKTADGLWHYFMSGDQAVAYYMRHTTITTEVTTAMKDWGYATDGQTPDTSSGQGQVALTVAVVYPDNTVSPAERNMYARSTTIFNYWAGRDIGIIAPLNNSEYEVSKITVTDGARDGNRNSNTWNASASINWEKTQTDSGSYWYDETEVWNKDMGTEPMVNGKASNIVFTGKNTAKLVLIYLEPVQNDNNLTVNWVDDSNSGALINTMPVVVRYEGSNEINFFNGLKQDSNVPQTGGSFTLDDDAYITNSSGVNQTFNKDITVMDVDPQYRSGLYQYSGADLSKDGKTLTLHYTLNAEALNVRYIVDFGLPVQVSVSDLVENADQVQSVTSSSDKISYDSNTKTITYTPSEILTGIDAVTVRVNYSGNTQRFSVGFVPATNVYYEEGFASYSDGWTGYSKGSGTQQTAAPGAENANQYGYDAKYADESNGASNGTQAVSSAYGDSAELTFTGTGIDIYTNSTPDSGRLFATVTNDAGSIVKVVQVETALKDGTTGATTGQAVNGYNVPVISLDLGTRDSYTVKLTHMKTTAEDESDTVSIDGYRVYGTLEDDRPAYASDGEANPTYVELRDQVLAALSVDTSGSQYADQIAENALSQVYSKAGSTAGAVVLSQYPYTEGDAQDLLDNGPKNELYLRAGESVVFSVTGSVQVGMKALNADVNYTINNGTEAKLTSSTDMYYKVDSSNVTITNNSGGILAITKVKVLGGTGTFAELTKADLMPALLSLGFESEAEEPVYADATANISLIDAAGSEIASTALTANGVAGETHTFAAADIQAAAEGILPEGYELTGEASDVEVVYGESVTVELQAEETAVEEPDGGDSEDEEGFFDKIGNAIKDVVDTVVDAVTGFFGSLFGW